MKATIPTTDTALSVTSNKKYSYSKQYLKKLPYPYEFNNIKSNFSKLKQAVFSRRPVLFELYKKYAKVTPLNYAHQYIQSDKHALYTQRLSEILDVTEQIITPRLSDKVARAVSNQIRETNFVSTADHHGPVLDPYFLNANLNASLAAHDLPKPLAYTVVFSCANVSLNNSTFPRGLSFTVQTPYGVQKIRLSLFEAASRLCSVINFRAYGQKELARMRKELNQQVAKGIVEQAVAAKVEKIIQDIYADPQVLAMHNYAEQVTLTNYKLWQAITAGFPQPSPDLIYIEQEEVVLQAICRFHLQSDSVVHKILFDPEVRSRFTQIFNGVEGGFDTERSIGSFLFWALPPGAKYRTQLWLVGDALISADGSVRYELTPEVIAQAIADRQLIPSMLLSFVVIAFYYGIRCLGGFCQVNYLTEMKNRYSEFCEAAGYPNEKEAVQSVETKMLCEDMSIAFLQLKKGGVTLANGLDLLLYGTENMYERLYATATRITMAQALDLMMPEFYTVMYPEKERTEELLTITPVEISDYKGIASQVHPSAAIKP